MPKKEREPSEWLEAIRKKLTFSDPPRSPSPPRSEKELLKELSLYPDLLFPGELLKQSPDPLNAIVRRHTEWAENILRKAGLPATPGLHYYNGKRWVRARLSGFGPFRMLRIGKRVYLPGDPECPPLASAHGAIPPEHRVSVETFAADTLVWAENLTLELKAGHLEETLGCFYQMMLFGRIGLYLERVDRYARAGLKARLGRRLIGAGSRANRKAQILAMLADYRSRMPKASERNLEERVAKDLQVSRSTVRRARGTKKVVQT